jgi:hypothetical protein
MNRRNNTRRKRRGRKRPRNRVTEVVLSRRDPSFPPQNNVKPSTTRSFRFFVTGQVTASPVTRRCLLNLVLAGTSGSTTAVNVYEAVRLDRINMYFVGSGLGGAADELVLSWTGDRAPDTRYSDRGSSAHPACIKCRPPQKSLAGFWSTVFADMDEPLCYITAPTGTVVDIQVAMVIGDAATKTCVILNPGLSGIVYCALDNAIVAGTVGAELMTPDSLTYANMTTP